MIAEEVDDEFGFYEGECQGCALFLRLDDMGLCETCSGKLERDLIRQRDWAYSVLAFGVPDDKREELRHAIIKNYGEGFELIIPEHKTKRTGRSRKKSKPHPGRNR